MPTILFVMKYPLHRSENLKAKFDGQLAAARALGWDAYHIGWDQRGLWLMGDGSRVLLKRGWLATMPGYDHTAIFPDLMTAVRKALGRIHVDVLYLRYMPTFCGAPRTIRRVKAQGGKVVMEYPTYPCQAENDRFFLRRQVFRFSNSILRRIQPMVDLFTLIGAPCVDGMLHGRPAMNIVNGVAVERLPLHAPNTADATIRLLALASMSGWHGYDRILSALASYQGEAQVRIDFVGGDGDGSLAAWKRLAETLGITDRVTFHGALYGEALERVVAMSDIGVGSLGMYRYGLAVGTTLKLREYMARGLPFLTAVEDPALPEDAAFALRVPNDDSSIDMAEVVAFAQRAKQDAEAPLRMRDHAVRNLSWEGVFAQVLGRVYP